MGGINPWPVTAVEAYDLEHDSWADAAPMPEGRAAMALATGPDGAILAIGGYGAHADDTEPDGLVGPTDIYVPT